MTRRPWELPGPDAELLSGFPPRAAPSSDQRRNQGGGGPRFHSASQQLAGQLSSEKGPFHSATQHVGAGSRLRSPGIHSAAQQLARPGGSSGSIHDHVRRFRDEHALVQFMEERVGQGSFKRVAATNGGEWAGPCPMCGGDDRLRAWPNPREGHPRAWCRQCHRSGDVLDWSTWLSGRDPNARGSIAQSLRDAGYLEAARASGVEDPAPNRARNPVSNSATAPAREKQGQPRHPGDGYPELTGEGDTAESNSEASFALPIRRSAWPADAREDFEERAGIMEFDGELDRAEAERMAEASIRAKWASRTDRPAQDGGGA